MPFRGASLRLDSDQADLVFPYTVQWDAAEYDCGGFFNPKLPTSLTIPKGVVKVRLYAGIELEMGADSPHSTFVNFRKNDRNFHGNPASNVRQGGDGWGKNVYTLSSPPIAVEFGDVFELRINQSLSGLTLNKLLRSPTSYMAIEAVEWVDA